MVATAITEQTATAITMTVPDRNGDGSPDRGFLIAEVKVRPD